MKLILGIATCVWCIIVVVMPSSAIEDAVVGEQLQLSAYQTVSFDLEDGASGYSTFLTNLRQKFEGPLKACGLPVTRDTLPKGGEYVLADLKISTTEWVTVALKVTDLYLVAYRVNKLYSGKYHAIFLNEPDVADAKAKLFIGSTPVTLKYDSNYANIEKYAGSRKNIALGLQDLRKKIQAFYNDATPVTPAEEAKFLLIAIQMVSEAARYNYIEDKVVESGDFKSFKPDAKMISLETSWQKTSDAVRKAETDKKCESQEVKDIKKDTKLLKHKRNKLNTNESGGGLWSEVASTITTTDVIDGGVFEV